MVKVGINGAYPPTTRAPRIDARCPSPPWIEPRASTPIVGEQTSRCPRLTIDRLPRLNLPVNLLGFGRIGRLAFRLAYDHPELEFVHINEFPGAGESGGDQVKDIRSGEQADANAATWACPTADLRPSIVTSQG